MVLLLVGCSVPRGGLGEPDRDASVGDVGTADSANDSAVDASADATSDTLVIDVGVDAFDASTDAVADVGADVPSDVPMIDAGPDACAEVACNTGDPGICASGVFNCALDRCLPERAPVVELCSNGLDDDCDGSTDEDACEECEDRYRDGRLYLFCTFEERWVDARDACEAFGMRIVAIQDATEKNWIDDQIDDIDDGAWWIGLYTPIPGSDRRNDHRWWPDDSDDPVPDYAFWFSGEPNNPSEDCIRIRDDPDRRWTDRSCDSESSEFPFICEPN